MQTADPGTFPRNSIEGFNKLRAAEGLHGFYKGLPPLMCRQIPYTVVKFVTFEHVVKLFYNKVFLKPKEEYSKFT